MSAHHACESYLTGPVPPETPYFSFDAPAPPDAQRLFHTLNSRRRLPSTPGGDHSPLPCPVSWPAPGGALPPRLWSGQDTRPPKPVDSPITCHTSRLPPHSSAEAPVDPPVGSVPSGSPSRPPASSAATSSGHLEPPETQVESTGSRPRRGSGARTPVFPLLNPQPPPVS